MGIVATGKLSLPFKHVGLTGGIACGKSTVARLLAEKYGAHVIDADQLARDVVEQGKPAYRQILDHFGPKVLRPDSSIDRKRLAALVFADPVERATLESMIHPRVREAARQTVARLAARPVLERPKLVVEVVPLLLEVGLEREFDEIWVVSCPRAVQIQRLTARDGITAEEAQARLNAQWPIEQKVERADRVIDNSAGILELDWNLANVMQEAKQA
jgi:dephospho-CoA kinase